MAYAIILWKQQLVTIEKDQYFNLDLFWLNNQIYFVCNTVIYTMFIG